MTERPRGRRNQLFLMKLETLDARERDCGRFLWKADPGRSGTQMKASALLAFGSQRSRGNEGRNERAVRQPVIGSGISDSSGREPSPSRLEQTVVETLQVSCFHMPKRLQLAISHLSILLQRRIQTGPDGDVKEQN
ncbi:hypothetical protein QQF64_031279 [Cirrhinus molitorella]|uniref:Uncharacterized protein n=1 Tax=Cirrhinus molitorella TaxID=172907 RepID=A0ABR3MWP3_9TELE